MEERSIAALTRLFPRAAAAGRLPRERYNTRIFLSSYMIQMHPGVVLTDPAAPAQAALQQAARAQLYSFDALLASLASSCIGGGAARGHAFQEWNGDWVAYLELFATWKLKDAAALEVHAAPGLLTGSLRSACTRRSA